MAARVLVIRGGAVGDFILTLPAIRLLREGLPGCHLEVLGYPGIVDLALVARLADAVRNLEHRSMAPLFAPGAAVPEEVAEYLCSFHLVVSYLFDPDGHFRGNLERLGVKTLLECPHRVQTGQGPAAVQLARPLERLALFLDDPAPRIGSPVEVSRDAGLDEQTTLILHPGSGSESKTWPLECWRSVLEGWLKKTPLKSRLIIVTGEVEAERGILSQFNHADWAELRPEVWQNITLAQLAERLCSLAQQPGGAWFFGHDSGVSHLAAAVGLPCRLLFGPTDPKVWAPQNSGVRVLRSSTGEMADLETLTVLNWLWKTCE